jgi:hypothetical protein
MENQRKALFNNQSSMVNVHRCPTAFLPKLSSKLKAESSKGKQDNLFNHQSQ